MTHEKLISGDELVTELVGDGGIKGISQLGTGTIKLGGEVVAKNCNTCGIMRYVKEYRTHRHSLGGVVAKCKPCEKQYRKENKKERALMTADEKKASHRAWYLANKDYLVEKTREWRRKNPGKDNEYSRKYYYNNIEARKLYNKKNAGKLRDWYLQDYANDPVKYSEAAKAWRKKNPEKHKALVQRRAARERLLPDSLTAEEYLATCKYFGDSCALTGAPKKLHADHVIPLSTGHVGSVKGNIVPLESKLNLSKNDKNVFEWFYENKDRFDLSQKKFNKLVNFLAKENDMSLLEYTAFVYDCHNNPRKQDEMEAIT